MKLTKSKPMDNPVWSVYLKHGWLKCWFRDTKTNYVLSRGVNNTDCRFLQILKIA